MNLMNEREIDFPRTVTVTRLPDAYDNNGGYVGEPAVVVSGMVADIQQSLRVRSLQSEDRTGCSDNTAWLMFCLPPAPLREGDRVSDGCRTFVIDSVADWGSHVECTMRKQ
jgi:hypothetical protein